jgi:hypothetical protein
MLQKLSRLEWGVVGAGAIALISLFLPWYGASVLGYSSSVSGFGTSYGWLGGLLIVAAGVVLFLRRGSQVDMSKLPAGPAVIVLAASALGTLIVVIRWATLPSGSGGFGGVTYSYGPRVGLIITLVMGIVQVVCGFMLFRASGEPLPWNTAATATTAPGSTTPIPGSGMPVPTHSPDLGTPTGESGTTNPTGGPPMGVDPPPTGTDQEPVDPGQPPTP